MIVSASYRTDIPAFYGDWFMRRLEDGFAAVRNPYSGKPYRVALDPASVDGFVFWTRNVAPFMPALEILRERGYRFVVQFTITGYPRPLETSVIDAAQAADQIRRLADQYGPRAVVWRYDPILESSLTPPDFHRTQIARLAQTLSGAVDECCVSWASIYRKSARNLEAAARRHEFNWRDPDESEKRALLSDLAALVRAQGMAMTLCSQPDLLTPGVSPARCIDTDRLSDVVGRKISAKPKGNRPGCDCAESRDIGDYDTCPHGCVYCYANSSASAARKRRKAHNPATSSLTGF